jgi:WD40 repeat protein
MEQVTLVRWHPVASNLLLSVAFDNTARVWDVNKVRIRAAHEPAAETATFSRLSHLPSRT